MKALNRIMYLIYCVFVRDVYKKAEYLKRHKIFKSMGDNNRIALFMIPADAKRITLHDNISISTGTSFICHDSINMLINHLDIPGVGNLKNTYEPIEVFSNVFIGANCLILPGVKIGPNAIVAAGAVVSKDVPEGTIVGGCPAKVIGSFDDLVNRRIASFQNN